MKKEEALLTVEAYRVPRFQWAGLIKSIFTLGFSNAQMTVDEALLYRFEVHEPGVVQVYSESTLGSPEEVERFEMELPKFKQLVKETNQYQTAEYIYKFDPDTLHEKS